MLTFLLGNVVVAGLLGFCLSIYCFMFRLHLANPWRWLAGIGGGLIIGTLLAVIDFLIIWPPTNIFVSIFGFACIAATAMALIGYPRVRQLTRR